MNRQKRFLVDMTEEEFFQKLNEHLGIQRKEVDESIAHTSTHGRLVYGLRGIHGLFNCSHKQAQFYKDHVITEAVIQNGRKIVVEADLALELFNSRRKK